MKLLKVNLGALERLKVQFWPKCGPVYASNRYLKRWCMCVYMWFYIYEYSWFQFDPLYWPKRHTVIYCSYILPSSAFMSGQCTAGMGHLNLSSIKAAEQSLVYVIYRMRNPPTGIDSNRKIHFWVNEIKVIALYLITQTFTFFIILSLRDIWFGGA